MGLFKSASKKVTKRAVKTHKPKSTPKPKKTQSAPSITVLRRRKTISDKKIGTKLVKHSKYVSRTECYIALYLSFYFTTIQQYKIKGVNHVFDIYLPQINLIIEYDGKKWHKNRNHDMEIDKIAVSNGHRILRIKEDNYYANGKLEYVKRVVGMYSISILTKVLTETQKQLLSAFWKK